MQIRSATMTDVGQVREQNEDSLLVREDLGLYVVADGMGGHLGGKTASALAVSAIEKFVAEHIDALRADAAIEPAEHSPTPRYFADAIRLACETIHETSLDDASLQGMGTTVTALLIAEKRAFVAHVGDSRCYLQRGEGIMQVTDDHSLVNEQVKAGVMTREEARHSALKNIITRSVGFERDVAVDTFVVQLEDGDKLMLCSDGLSNLVEEIEIGLALADQPLEAVPMALVDLANRRGGDDNITVVCLQVEL